MLIVLVISSDSILVGHLKKFQCDCFRNVLIRVLFNEKANYTVSTIVSLR
jgi:hypothetical protein